MLFKKFLKYIKFIYELSKHGQYKPYSVVYRIGENIEILHTIQYYKASKMCLNGLPM